MTKMGLFLAFVLFAGVLVSLAGQSGLSDDAGRVLALETAWNHAIESKDTKATDIIEAGSMVAVGSDGTLANKNEYLGGINASGFQPSQAINEKNDIHMYGETAVAVGVFRTKEMEKGEPVTHRERTVDTWVKVGGTWKCVAAVAVKIPTGN
jgi:ketosteroid isomerase-like protein